MLPKVIIHTEVSVDGRMDRLGDDGFLYYRLIADWPIDAMLSGSRTMLAAYPNPDDGDEPPPPEKAPDLQRLVVVDSRGSIQSWRQMQQSPWWGEITLLCTAATPPAYVEQVKALGIDVLVAGEDRVDFKAALEALNARYGIRVVRTDTGGVLHGVLLRAGLVDEISIVLAPTLIGGTSPASFFVAPDLSPQAAAPNAAPIGLKLLHVENVEGDFVWLRYAVCKGERA
ncbi:MAG: RibD family protein [Anaerolineae bacterium]|nr:RibD family protein [Anaerolineae bacterium]